MFTLDARETLSSIWPVLLAARSRSLLRDEMEQLRELCQVLAEGIPGRSDYNQAVEQFCLSVHTSGLFESRAIKPKAVDRLLEYIEGLRLLLIDSPERDVQLS